MSKKSSQLKHSLQESWWHVGFDINWLCKKQGNKVLSEGKMYISTAYVCLCAKYRTNTLFLLVSLLFYQMCCEAVAA